MVWSIGVFLFLFLNLCLFKFALVGYYINNKYIFKVYKYLRNILFKKKVFCIGKNTNNNFGNKHININFVYCRAVPFWKHTMYFLFIHVPTNLCVKQISVNKSFENTH